MDESQAAFHENSAGEPGVFSCRGAKEYEMNRKIYLGRDRKIAGVCSGIADYFGWDPTIVRLAWVVFTLIGGSGILAYIIAMIVMPERPDRTDDL
jgi:phage shock protein C